MKAKVAGPADWFGGGFGGVTERCYHSHFERINGMGAGWLRRYRLDRGRLTVIVPEPDPLLEVALVEDASGRAGGGSGISSLDRRG